MHPGGLARLSISMGMAGWLASGGFSALDAQHAPAPSITAELAPSTASGLASATPTGVAGPHLALVDDYCLSCHDKDHEKGGLALDAIAADAVVRHPEVWEKVVRKLRARQMPPVGKERPDDTRIRSRSSTRHTSPDITGRNARRTRTAANDAARCGNRPSGRRRVRVASERSARAHALEPCGALIAQWVPRASARRGVRGATRLG